MNMCMHVGLLTLSDLQQQQQWERNFYDFILTVLVNLAISGRRRRRRRRLPPLPFLLLRLRLLLLPVLLLLLVVVFCLASSPFSHFSFCVLHAPVAAALNIFCGCSFSPLLPPSTLTLTSLPQTLPKQWNDATSSSALGRQTEKQTDRQAKLSSA